VNGRGYIAAGSTSVEWDLSRSSAGRCRPGRGEGSASGRSPRVGQWTLGWAFARRSGNPGYPPAVANLGQDRNPLQGLSVLGRIELGKSNVEQRVFAVPIDEVCWGLFVRYRVELR
jgi:hypothetical protein